MRNHQKRSTWSVILAVVGIAAIAAAIASSATARATKAHATAAGTINVDLGVAPQSLDPGLDYTSQGEETNWLVYTGLTTYARKPAAPAARS